ncbi:hypothetical protein Pse7367_1701 [Thalassoporum mexicanum PCC 7367]|uniref:GDYXXLXY domain-containing protein n=1 Tax=Thalassoporum mexicanum TaxID=3457544 RepID=UPI00029FE32C|nr:GDYXXLXY domain-containing protein [Pseudanabaena sp. PCC 7367]AFY69987.1 hypothetical protein Pse7367_1701 [Pseudanabaena sp. PCC 7367]
MQPNQPENPNQPDPASQAEQNSANADRAAASTPVNSEQISEHPQPEEPSNAAIGSNTSSTSTFKQTQQPERRKIGAWRMWAPIGCQSLLILSVLIAPLQAHLNGKTVVLRTQPIDPYDLLRGYSQTLSYDISNLDNLQELPGWETLPKTQFNAPNRPQRPESGTSFYLVLKSPDRGSSDNQAPNPWTPVRIASTEPQTLASNEVMLKGKIEWSAARYGLERYYMPESRRDEINNAVNLANRNQTGAVEIKVRQDGYAVPVKLWVGQEDFEF